MLPINRTCGRWIAAVISLACLSLTANANDLLSARGIFGSEQYLTDLPASNAEAIVLVFLDPDCPVARQYLPTLRELYRHYNEIERDRAGRPVRQQPGGKLSTFRYPGDRVCFLGIYSMPEIGIREMAAHAQRGGIPFRVLQDNRQEVMNAFGVTELAEVVVTDRHWNVMYQGTIDDQFFPGGSKPKPRNHYLREAIDQVLAGHKVKVPKRPPQGCVISRLDPERKYPEKSFHEHVEPILQAKCQKCHHEGGVGPMPLIDFNDVDRYAEMIEEVVLDRRMPPFPGDSTRDLNEDSRLTKSQIETLIAWIRGGRQRGNSASAPPAKQWQQSEKWQIGQPDYVFEMPKAFEVPASGLIDYLYYPIPAGFPEDRYIKAIETAPGSPEVVHHIQVTEFVGEIKPDDNERLNVVQQMLHYGPAIDGAKLLGSYTPGDNRNVRLFGPDAAVKLTRGAHLLLELHYTPNGRTTTDRSRVGIIFADQPPAREIKTRQYVRKRGDFIIPANTQNHSMQKLYHFEKPVRILALRPHMHSRGKSIRFDLVDSADVRLQDVHDRSSHHQRRGETVLSIPIWDFNWQLTYEFAEPLIVPRGKALLGTAIWDNSPHNPRNPDWTVDVPWGQQTIHEMFNVMILFEELE